MTRLLLLPPLLGLLTACDPAPRPIGGDESALPPVATVPVELPMDLGMISCRQITGNSVYLSAAVDWIDGRWRAATLAGVLPGPVPARAEMSARIADYCGNYPDATVQDALGALSAG